MARSVLEIRNLWAEADGAWACRDVSFEAGAGRILAVIGGPGSGKSALLGCLGLIARPLSGQIRLHGVDVSGATGERRRQLRARSILTVRGEEPAPSTSPAPGVAALAAHRRPVLAVPSQYDVLVLDEPAGVSRGGRLALPELRRLLRANGSGAAVIATRHPDVAGVLADDVVVLHRGAVVETGSSAQVLGSPVHPHTRSLLLESRRSA